MKKALERIDTLILIGCTFATLVIGYTTLAKTSVVIYALNPKNNAFLEAGALSIEKLRTYDQPSFFPFFFMVVVTGCVLVWPISTFMKGAKSDA